MMPTLQHKLREMRSLGICYYDIFLTEQPLQTLEPRLLSWTLPGFVLLCFLMLPWLLLLF